MNDEQQRLEKIFEFMRQFAGEQVNQVELAVQRNPERHRECHESMQDVDRIEEELERRIGDMNFFDDCSAAFTRYAAALAMEAYLRGVKDGGLLHHVLVCGEW